MTDRELLELTKEELLKMIRKQQDIISRLKGEHVSCISYSG